MYSSLGVQEFIAGNFIITISNKLRVLTIKIIWKICFK